MNEPNFDPFPILRTERLVLRQLTRGDDELIYDYMSDKVHFKYVDMPIYTRLEEAQNYIAKMNAGVAGNKWIIWAIADVATDRILGTISIWNISEAQSKAELGYGLFPGNLGKGFMGEALMKVIEFGFDVMGLETIEAYTNISNKPSIALLERHRFSKVSTFTETETWSGEPMGMVIYQIKRPDLLEE